MGAVLRYRRTVLITACVWWLGYSMLLCFGGGMTLSTEAQSVERMQMQELAANGADHACCQPQAECCNTDQISQPQVPDWQPMLAMLVLLFVWPLLSQPPRRPSHARPLLWRSPPAYQLHCAFLK